MKEVFNKVKTSILFYAIIASILFIILCFTLKYFDLRFRPYIFFYAPIILMIFVVIGIFQIIRKKGKIFKFIYILLSSFWLSVSIILSCALTFFMTLYYGGEHIVEKDNKKYVACHSGFTHVEVDYYNYINAFLVGNKVIFEENYGRGAFCPFDGNHNEYKPIETTYYDEDGKVIKVIEENVDDEAVEEEKKDNIIATIEEKIKEEIVKRENILYEKVIDDKTIIRVVYKDSVLAQRSLIGISKTTDGGNTWEEQIQYETNCLQIHNGSKFIFLNENIGFINDPGQAGTNGDNRSLLVTLNGGQTFSKSNFIKPNNLKDKDLFIDDVPYIENNILKVKVYTVNYNPNSYLERTYYDFYSEDNGLNWSCIE